MFGLTSRSKDPWPLKFTRHNFEAACHNTQRCSVVYDRDQFTRRYEFEASGPPPAGDWKQRWTAGTGVDKCFPPPAQVDWISLDGTEHHARIDIGAMFKDRLVRHNVPREDIPEGWLAANAIDPVSIHVLMEINDRTITVYTRAHVATKSLRVPGNDYSNYRNDLIEVWTHTY
jgi:hypothetical protein